VVTAEYELIARVYADRTAKRSGVRLIEHIDHGLRVLGAIGASDDAQRAFCLHPLVQEDADLREHFETCAATTTARVLALAIEYRWVANSALSSRELAGGATDIQLSPLREVNDMLVADKVQNYRDFLAHHAGSHPRAAALDRYFRLWLERLGVAIDRFEQLARL
jgi:hypothetical protein